MVEAAPFLSYRHRTQHVSESRAFYEPLFGDCSGCIHPLPDAARKNGAPPHWLGYVDVAQPLDKLAEIEAAGGRVLGPRPSSDGSLVVRDPGGAIFGLSSSGTKTDAARGPEVGWSILHSLLRRELAVRNYCAWFSWRKTETLNPMDLGSYDGVSWRSGEGAIGDLESRPDVHPHWLHCFSVASLASSVEAARAVGASCLGPTELPNGRTIAVCEDPWGAAFGMVQ